MTNNRITNIEVHYSSFVNLDPSDLPAVLVAGVEGRCSYFILSCMPV